MNVWFFENAFLTAGSIPAAHFMRLFLFPIARRDFLRRVYSFFLIKKNRDFFLGRHFKQGRLPARDSNGKPEVRELVRSRTCSG